jgi:hypothetical protein
MVAKSFSSAGNSFIKDFVLAALKDGLYTGSSASLSRSCDLHVVGMGVLFGGDESCDYDDAGILVLFCGDLRGSFSVFGWGWGCGGADSGCSCGTCAWARQGIFAGVAWER